MALKVPAIQICLLCPDCLVMDARSNRRNDNGGVLNERCSGRKRAVFRSLKKGKRTPSSVRNQMENTGESVCATDLQWATRSGRRWECSMWISKSSFALGWVCLGLSCSVSIAQQNLPRPIVLYRPPAIGTPTPRGSMTLTRPVSQALPTQNPAALPMPNSSASSAQFPSTPTTPYLEQRAAVVSGQAQTPAANPANINAAASVTGLSAPTTAGRSPDNGSNESQNKTETQQQADEREAAAQQARPTLQMLQNPSGGYSLSHSGTTTGQQMAPNLYFGPQFQSWTNQQGMAQMPGAYGEMSRFQPAPFGGYTAPNTYFGSGFSNWTNLSSGSIAPGSQGGWSYSVWP
jgi:hypothetical protein